MYSIVMVMVSFKIMFRVRVRFRIVFIVANTAEGNRLIRNARFSVILFCLFVCFLISASEILKTKYNNKNKMSH